MRTVAIGERLKEYAQARPEGPDKLRSEIRDKADKLGAELDRAGQSSDRGGLAQTQPTAGTSGL